MMETMADPISVTEPAAAVETATSALAAAERAIREADPAAFPVASRIVRRVIRHEIDLPALIARVPHRKSFHVGRPSAQIVANDELGLENGGRCRRRDPAGPSGGARARRR